MSLNSEKPTTLHFNLPYTYSHLFKCEHKSVNYSKALHHLQDFFKAIFETHPSAIMGYPRENCHAKHFLDNCEIPCINLDAVGIKESISKLFDTCDNIPEDIKPCTLHTKSWLEPFRCTRVATYILAERMKCIKGKELNFSPEVEVHVLAEEDRKGPWEAAARDRIRFVERVRVASELLAPIFSPYNRKKAAERTSMNFSSNAD